TPGDVNVYIRDTSLLSERGVLLDEAIDQPTTSARRLRAARRRRRARRLRRRLAQELDGERQQRLEREQQQCRAHGGVEPAERNHPELQPIRALVGGRAARSHLAGLRAAAAGQRGQAGPVLQLA